MEKVIGENIYCTDKCIFRNLFNEGFEIKQLERKLIGFRDKKINKVGFYFPRKKVKESILIAMRVSDFKENNKDYLREFNLILRDLNSHNPIRNRDYFSKSIIYDLNNYLSSDVYVGDFANSWLNYNYKK